MAPHKGQILTTGMSENYTMRGMVSTKPYEEFSPGTVQSFDKNR